MSEVDALQEGNNISTDRVSGGPARSKLHRTLRRIFCFPTMLASVLIVLAVLTARDRFDDPDMWWHLKTGEIIVTTHTIPVSDTFSYTTNHQASVPQEWLAQASIFAAYRFAGGFSGLMLWMCVLASALFIAGYILCTLYSGNAKVAFVGALIIWFFSTVGFSVRPQMIGYLFLIVELIFIHLGRTGNPRWFFSLPVLFAIWINCHGSFLLGLIVAGVFLFSSFFEFRLGSLFSSRWDSQHQRAFSLSLALSFGALFLNPVGVNQILYPINTILHQSIGLSNSEEWKATQLTDGRGIGLMLVVCCCFLLVIIRRSELSWSEILILGLGTWLGVSHMRMLFVFGILVAPILSRELSTMWEGYDPEQDRIWPNAVFVLLSIAVAYIGFPDRENLQRQTEALSPVKAVQFIKNNHLSGPMLNEDVFGGYLIWAAPEYPVFMDGRSDVYEWSGVLSEFGNWATVNSDPSVLLNKYHVNFCLLGNHSPMIQILPLLHEWKLAYSDDTAVVFVRIPSSSPGH